MRAVGRSAVRVADLFQLAPLPVRLLLAARFSRSVWQGALVADFALYLERLHWRGDQIGMLFAASFVVGAMLSLLVGPLGDRCGYRRLLIGYEATVAALFVAAACSTNPCMISGAAIFGGFGRGANGAPGCFVPAELAWLAALLPDRARAAVFSLNTALGFAGMAVGGLIAVGPDLWAGWLSGPAAFQLLFVIGAVLSVGNAGLLHRAPATGSGRPDTMPQARRPPMTTAGRGLLARAAAINLCNGISVGLSGPLIAYWFAAKFHVGPMQIGSVMMLCFLAAGLCAAFLSGAAAPRAAALIYIRMQWVSLLLLMTIPFLASFPLAAAAWIVKFALERGTAGAMEAVNVGLAGPGRWGLASGLSVASLALPRSIGPALAGHWIASAAFARPLLAAALFQAAYLWLYRTAILPAGRCPDRPARSQPA